MANWGWIAFLTILVVVVVRFLRRGSPTHLNFDLVGPPPPVEPGHFHYAMADREIEDAAMDRTVFAQALTEGGNDPDRVKQAYLRLRARQLAEDS